MTEFKIVLGTKEGKSYQKVIKDEPAENLLKRRIGETIRGEDIGFPGYEFLVAGGSDKCGFPMRKGIQQPRKKILMGKGVGFSGLDRNKKKRPGLITRKTVCGEMITKIIHQINLKVLKEGPQSLEEPKKEEAPAGQEGTV